jgi:hypothetical protein
MIFNKLLFVFVTIINIELKSQNQTKVIIRKYEVYELSPIEDYNIYKDYLPLYTTVLPNVYKNI